MGISCLLIPFLWSHMKSPLSFWDALEPWRRAYDFLNVNFNVILFCFLIPSIPCRSPRSVALFYGWPFVNWIRVASTPECQKNSLCINAPYEWNKRATKHVDRWTHCWSMLYFKKRLNIAQWPHMARLSTVSFPSRFLQITGRCSADSCSKIFHFCLRVLRGDKSAKSGNTMEQDHVGDVGLGHRCNPSVWNSLDRYR